MEKPILKGLGVTDKSYLRLEQTLLKHDYSIVRSALGSNWIGYLKIVYSNIGIPLYYISIKVKLAETCISNEVTIEYLHDKYGKAHTTLHDSTKDVQKIEQTAREFYKLLLKTLN